MNVLGLSVTSNGKDPCPSLTEKEFVKIIVNSSLDQSILKEINPKYSLEGLYTEAEAPILWPSDEKSQLTGKRPRCWERLRAEGEGGSRG